MRPFFDHSPEMRHGEQAKDCAGRDDVGLHGKPPDLLISCKKDYLAKYLRSVASPGFAKLFVASDTTIISIAEIKVIGTTGSIPMTNVPAAPRVTIAQSPIAHTTTDEPGGGAAIVF